MMTSLEELLTLPITHTYRLSSRPGVCGCPIISFVRDIRVAKWYSKRHLSIYLSIYLSDTKAELVLPSPLESHSGYRFVKSDLTSYHTTTTHQNVVQNDKAIITKVQSHYSKLRILLARKFDCTCNAHLTAEHPDFPHSSSPSTC